MALFGSNLPVGSLLSCDLYTRPSRRRDTRRRALFDRLERDLRRRGDDGLRLRRGMLLLLLQTNIFHTSPLTTPVL